MCRRLKAAQYRSQGTPERCNPVKNDKYSLWGYFCFFCGVVFTQLNIFTHGHFSFTATPFCLFWDEGVATSISKTNYRFINSVSLSSEHLRGPLLTSAIHPRQRRENDRQECALIHQRARGGKSSGRCVGTRRAASWTCFRVRCARSWADVHIVPVSSLCICVFSGNADGGAPWA